MNIKYKIKSNSALNFIALMLFAGTMALSPAYAQSDDDWQYAGSINLWGAGIQGTAQNGTEIDVSFSDILDALDFTFMGTFEAQNSRWSLLGDYIYLKVSADQGGSLPTMAGTISRGVGVTVKSQIVNLIAGYNFSESESGRHEVVFGARNLDLTTQINVAVGGASAGTAASGDIWDGVVGLRGKVNLQGSWYLPYYLDIGSGQSDSTWQAMGGVGYKYKWGDLIFSYRHLEWEFDEESPIRDLNLSGPGILAKWYF